MDKDYGGLSIAYKNYTSRFSERFISNKGKLFIDKIEKNHVEQQLINQIIIPYIIFIINLYFFPHYSLSNHGCLIFEELKSI